MKRRTIALSGAAVMLAGTLGTQPASASPAPATAGDRPATGLAWEDCATERYPTLQCSSVEVPLDHRRPHGEKITLALSRVPATADTYQGPLLVNPGGPGGSGLGLAGYVASSLPEEVASQYDVIGFDPRGVGKSEPALNCRPGHFDPVRPDSVPRSWGGELKNVLRAWKFAEQCGKKHRGVLRNINTVNAAEDMDVIRRALGAGKINYFGYSYGTYLGAVYAKLHPDRVRRAVLDSVVNPENVWYDANIQQDYAFDARHKEFARWVAEHDAQYGLGTDPEKVEAAWYEMREAVRRDPAGGTVGGAELEDTFLPGGYYNGYWPTLAEAFSAYVTEGDEEPLVTAFENFAAVDAGGDNGYSVYTAVECRDASWPRDWGTWHRDMWKVHSEAPFMTWNNAWYNAPCAFWPTRSLTPPDVSNDDLPPVLIFQATDDAATPYEGGVVARRKLEGSSLVVEQGGGNHGISLSGNQCLDDHLVAYLADGEVPRGGTGEADAVCPALPEPEPAAAASSAEQEEAATAGDSGAAQQQARTKAADAPARSTAGDGAELHRLLGFRP
ncbi:alpha/beta hydrolase [Streptomyces sp. JJ36]|uniref:alpha/beta hydrolase n=1 Tax=Streptomyces sp. JJ36 TaxID=2736645 RepID=UPI001F213D9C|nr:alpha/beta hydrolase [Streptomyces sp. JJ36]MCF6521514.1 alpha/beta fold hydrolase [Streptomyces sp. JJ36]